MKITSIDIKNYTSFRNLSFDTAGGKFNNFNVLFGFNNSGKSNLIRFIHTIFMKKYGGVSVEVKDIGSISTEHLFEKNSTHFWEGQLIDSPYLFSDDNIAQPIIYSVTVEEDKKVLLENEFLNKIYEDTNEFVIKAHIVYKEHGISSVELQEVTLNGQNIFERIGGAPKYFNGNVDLQDNEVVFVDLLSVFDNSVSFIDSDRYFQKENELSEEVSLTPKTFKNWLYQLQKNAKTNKEFDGIVKSINEFVPSVDASKTSLKNNLENYPLNDLVIEFQKDGNKLLLVLKNKGGLPIESFGTGIQQFLYILTSILRAKSKVLIIEELELNLSPEYQKLLVDFIQECKDNTQLSQVFFTSHSNYMVDQMPVNGFFGISIDKNGESSIEFLTHGGAQAYFTNQSPSVS